MIFGINFLQLFQHCMVLKEENTMTEQDLLNMFIQERINMLIDMFHKNQTDKTKMEDEQIL